LTQALSVDPTPNVEQHLVLTSKSHILTISFIDVRTDQS
jgi:hypothetical protein